MSVRTASRDTGTQATDLLPRGHWIFAPVRWLRRLWQALTMRTVDIGEAEANLDHLIDDAEHGKPFTICVEGKPLLKVARIEKEELEKLPKVDD